MTPARSPEVIHCLFPFSTQPSPERCARVSSAEASLPACGSESANAPATAFPEVSRVTCRCFCSSVPKAVISSAHMLVTAIATAVDAQASATSIIASAYDVAPASAPPYAAGTFTPRRPSSAISASSSAGNCPFRSRSRAPGATRSRAKVRAVFRTSAWVSVRSSRISARPSG
jgi:hypothetical protein